MVFKTATLTFARTNRKSTQLKFLRQNKKEFILFTNLLCQNLTLHMLQSSFHFLFLVFGHFWQRSYENTKILRNLCLHFARQDGQDGQDRKKPKENHATNVTKIPKTKRRKYGMNKTFDKQ